MTDFAAMRKEFPILDQEIHGHPLVDLDSAATSQNPQDFDFRLREGRTQHHGVRRGTCQSRTSCRRQLR